MHTRSRGNIDRLVNQGTLITCLPLMYFLTIQYMMCWILIPNTWHWFTVECLPWCMIVLTVCSFNCVVPSVRVGQPQLRKCISCARIEPFMAQWFFSLGRECKREKLHSQSSVSNFAFFTRYGSHVVGRCGSAIWKCKSHRVAASPTSYKKI